ncbi:MAG: hypothetical protein CL753_08000 [Chloroflexi bacterium]|nr:hypothetical protein [Chloroflexota bacterium]|tara:strand:+ start:963 stop:2339 length:1377 start_codon:yes stop_codon:yes gene_type:complete
MKRSIKITKAKFVVTMDSERRIIKDGAVLIENDRIVKVGKTDASIDWDADQAIDASEMVITPGFVNGHLHASYAHATRGIFPDGLGSEYLPNVFSLQSAMTPLEEYWTSLLAITELLKYGTTCFLDPGSTKYLDACLSAYEQSGCRVVVGAQVVDKPNPLNLPVTSTRDASILIRDTIETYDHELDGRVRAWAMPFSPEFASIPLLRLAKDIADEHDTGLTLHFNNSLRYVTDCQASTGLRPSHMLRNNGILGTNVLLSHGLGLDESEVVCLAESGSKVVVCPTAAIKSGFGMTRSGLLPEMLTQGLTVCLGTDAGNNSNLVETMRSMYLAAVLYKDSREDVDLIPPETALEMATINGAEALGLSNEIGSIEIGKKADIVLFDTKRPEWRTMFNPINNLVYNADGRSVHTVIVDGRVVIENYNPVYADVWEIIQKVQEVGEHLLSRTGISFPSVWPII